MWKKLKPQTAKEEYDDRIFQSFLFQTFPYLSFPFPKMSTVFATLINAFPTWDALSAHLTSTEGGRLFIHTKGDLAIIRYVKGQSNMAMPHVGAFRSVVWNTVTNSPVSVTAFKSESGEGLPAISPSMLISLEEFVDGVLIGQFWDPASDSWRIHTRSTLDASCRYYSTRSFADLFADAKVAMWGADNLEDHLDKSVSYSWILQHPENRIVCPIQTPALKLVGMMRVGEDATVSVVPSSDLPAFLTKALPKQYFTKTAANEQGRLKMDSALRVIGMTNEADTSLTIMSDPETSVYMPMDVLGAIDMFASMRGSVRYQGIVIKTADEPFKRWKIRAKRYNEIRMMRGNTARRDFLWMDLWKRGTLTDYLMFYPEERIAANNLISRWKSITQDVYKIYVDVFKARSMDKTAIPPKFRTLVHGIHGHYLTVLRPARKSVDFRALVEWMNERDTALKIFVLNWEVRAAAAATNTIPIEASPAAAATAVAMEEA